MGVDVSEEIVRQLPSTVSKFLAFEQQNLWKPERLRIGTKDASFDGQYLPEAGRCFRLPCFFIPRKCFYVYGNRTSCDAVTGLWRGDGPDASVLFAIHPSEVERHREFLAAVRAMDADAHGVCLWATPTSSTRTVLAWPAGQPEGTFFAKLSLHSETFGNRRITRQKAATSIGMSELFHRCKSDLPAGIRYFRETIGIVPRAMRDSGAIFRSVPEELQAGRVVLAPLFSLIGGSRGHAPLLLQMTEAGGGSIREIVERVLLSEFASLWVDLVFDLGVILEAHGQDLLLALTPDLKRTGGFYYRDFEGLAVDWSLRSARGLSHPDALPNAFEWFRTYQTWGYPMYQLASTKMKISLFEYMNLVLFDLEKTLIAWQTGGAMPSERTLDGELTFLFSRYLRRAIREKFGMREAEEYDIRSQLNRFVMFLMTVRREIMMAGRS